LFFLLFGGLSLLFLVAIGTALVLIFASDQPGQQISGGILLGVCAIPVMFLFLAAAFGSWGFRRFAMPVGEMMAAVDAVASGDLSVRVRENVPGELGRLTRRFNHMIAELQRAEQQRRNLTADIAHELRTPLHIIQGTLEGMLDGVYPPDSENISATLEETRLLARLVNDLQTLSLAEAGQLPLHPVQLQAGDLLADVITSFAAQAEEQGVSLHLDLPADPAALALHADPDRLDQVLSNLVSNALRHTPRGGTITLGAAAIPGGVRLLVRDTGSGIPPEDLPYIFDRFWRGDRSRTRASGAGSGLGLAIARQLVRAHGGQIQVESQPAGGTRFIIELPGGAGG
jgi:two-component system OmpR family sensor kinase/two-component system sensor histidine kinase BaeS